MLIVIYCPRVALNISSYLTKKRAKIAIMKNKLLNKFRMLITALLGFTLTEYLLPIPAEFSIVHYKQK
jgi:hypothetical protein